MFLLFFLAENVGPNIPQKYQNPNIWRKKINKNRSLRLGRGTVNTCAKFHSLPLENGVDIGF